MSEVIATEIIVCGRGLEFDAEGQHCLPEVAAARARASAEYVLDNRPVFEERYAQGMGTVVLFPGSHSPYNKMGVPDMAHREGVLQRECAIARGLPPKFAHAPAKGRSTLEDILVARATPLLSIIRRAIHPRTTLGFCLPSC